MQQKDAKVNKSKLNNVGALEAPMKETKLNRAELNMWDAQPLQDCMAKLNMLHLNSKRAKSELNSKSTKHSMLPNQEFSKKNCKNRKIVTSLTRVWLGGHLTHHLTKLKH